MIPIRILPSLQVEGALAFIAGTGADASVWPRLVQLLAAMSDHSGDEQDDDEILRAAKFIAERFAPFFQAHAHRYAAAAGRIQEILSAHPRANLGALFGFDAFIDRRHLGLHRRVGPTRHIPAAGLAEIRLYPSACNPGHLWHLGQMNDSGPGKPGSHVIHLPVHDAALAAQCRPYLAELAKPVTITPLARADSGPPPLALVFRALGDASRFAMVEMLARGEMTGAEISRRLGLSTPAVTHHVNELRRAGLIDERRQGASIHLTLRRAVLENLTAMSVEYLFGKDRTATPRRSRQRKPPA